MSLAERKLCRSESGPRMRPGRLAHRDPRQLPSAWVARRNEGGHRPRDSGEAGEDVGRLAHCPARVHRRWAGLV